MRVSSSLLLFLLLCCPEARCQATGSAAAAPQDEAASWIRQLASDDFQKRDEAFEALTRLGRKAAGALREALKTADPETKLRIQTLLENLPPADREVKEVRLTQTTVDLVSPGASLEELVGRFEGLTGFRVQRPLPRSTRAKIRIDIDDRPAFEALDILAREAGLRWMIDGGTGFIRLIKGVAGKPLVLYEGPFRMALTSVSRNASLMFGSTPQDNCYIQMQIDIEPGAPVLGLWIPPTLTKAKDSTGRKLVPQTDTYRSYFSPTAGRRSFTTSLRLEPPAREATSIPRIEGSLRVAVARIWDKVTVAIPAEGESTPSALISGDLGVTILRRSKQGETTLLEVALARPTLYADEQKTRPIQEQTFLVLDAEGLEIPLLGRPQPGRRGDKEIFTLRLRHPAPDRLMVGSVSAFALKTVPFHFDNVPLP
ncbi:MAG TPA: hypothetical protein ENK43_15925 [Planctomycetes bacterium]|nr:hypothetical protein [Planctomycetota bacterium]